VFHSVFHSVFHTHCSTLENVHSVGSYCIIILQCTGQKTRFPQTLYLSNAGGGTTQSLRRSATSARRQMHQTVVNPVGRNLCMTR